MSASCTCSHREVPTARYVRLTAEAGKKTSYHRIELGEELNGEMNYQNPWGTLESAGFMIDTKHTCESLHPQTPGTQDADRSETEES
jgi:hypothetical protein